MKKLMVILGIAWIGIAILATTLPKQSSLDKAIAELKAQPQAERARADFHPTATATRARATTPVSPCASVLTTRYMDRVRTETEGAGRELEEIGLLFIAADNRPELLQNGDWIVNLSRRVVAMREHLDALEALNPPAVMGGELDSMQNLLLMMVDEFRQALDLMMLGVADLDNAALEQAAELISEAEWSVSLAYAAWQLACE